MTYSTNEPGSAHSRMDLPSALSDDLPELSLPSGILYARRGPAEQLWIDKQRFLAKKGYLLRPRYSPDWIPSWQATPDRVHMAEDSMSLPVMYESPPQTRF